MCSCNKPVFLDVFLRNADSFQLVPNHVIQSVQYCEPPIKYHACLVLASMQSTNGSEVHVHVFLCHLLNFVDP